MPDANIRKGMAHGAGARPHSLHPSGLLPCNLPRRKECAWDRTGRFADWIHASLGTCISDSITLHNGRYPPCQGFVLELSTDPLLLFIEERFWRDTKRKGKCAVEAFKRQIEVVHSLLVLSLPLLLRPCLGSQHSLLLSLTREKNGLELSVQWQVS